jgi:uncharacterized membrane protein
MNLNILIVIVMSTAFYHEPIGFFEVVGILLLLVAVVLVSIRKEPLTIKEKKWFYLIAFAIFLFTFRSGGLKVTEESGLNNTQVLFFAYLFSTFWFWLILLVSSGRKAKEEQASSKRVGLSWGLLCGLFSYGGLELYAYALEIGKASIIAPIFATNSLVVAVGSVIMYKERLKTLQAIALVFLFIGLVFIKM